MYSPDILRNKNSNRFVLARSSYIFNDLNLLNPLRKYMKERGNSMKFLILVLGFLPAILLAADINTPPLQEKQVFANRLDEKIIIDGILNESIWHNGNGISEFIQREPKEGGQPSEKTEVHIAYDDDALYVGARMYDSCPDSIVTQLARRDYDLNSDVLGVYIDPYYDRRSGFYFGVSAGGTLYDGVLYNDDWDDDSWDGVWEGRASCDAEGWTAEFRIPFSQLRFQKKDKYVWGINFRRDIKRYNEEDYLVYTPKNSSGFVSRFLDLVGIEAIEPGRNFEMLPYVRTKAEYIHQDGADPFNDGSKYAPDLGVDLKLGLGSNLTLDMTINPDFGQVEVDPAVVNLGDVETFYGEKRPFFIEGASIFEFGYGGSHSFWGFNWGGPDFFYSRRIGRAPAGSHPDNDYSDVPDGTKILGAAKVTGKVANNWNIGTIHALTSREMGDFSYENRQFETELEPMAYYGVFRAQKEIDEGRQGIGMISTVNTRKFKDRRLADEMNSGAYTFGVDGWTFLDSSKTWVLTGWGGGSHVTGNSAQMLELQQSSRHYFQRPDAEHVTLDSTATSLDGFAGRLLLNKQKGNVLLNTALGIISPGFDVNDTGFLWRGDMINMHFGGGYKWTKPTSWYRQTNVLAAIFQTYDFDGNVTWRGVWNHFYIKFPSYWEISLSTAYNPETVNTRLTRGGPSTINLPGYEWDVWVNTDNRKPWEFGFGGYSYRRNADEYSLGINGSVEWKPRPNLTLSMGPEIFWNKEFAQWVDVFADPTATHTFNNRYVFAEMDQTQLSANIRLNWTFSPQLSFQLYAQPLISHGDYQNYKELARPGTFDFNKFKPENITLEDGEYEIDPDGSGPAESIGFSDPDFYFKSFRGNAVLRWEYQPGSTLYLVWTQSRTNDEYADTFTFNRSMKKLFNAPVDNIFMVKFTYWWNM